MIHTQNHRVLGEVPSAAIGATATATLTIDTLGWDYASVSVMRCSNSVTTFANVLKIDESDTNLGGSFTDVTAFVAGGTGGFTVPAITVAGTALTQTVKMDIDTRTRKRYLRVNYTPGASCNVAITGRLARGEASPSNASEAGVIAWVRG